jgi:hypothetical protein
MKLLRLLILFIICCCFISSSIVAEEKWTPEKIYKHFRYSYSPKEVFQSTQKDVQWFSKQCKKGKKQCALALQEFNKSDSKYVAVNWPMDGYHPHYTVFNCKTHLFVGHSNKALHRILNNPKVDLRKVKDKAGRALGLIACNIVEKYPGGSWMYQITTWDRSITKLSDTIITLGPVFQVKGTDYQILTSFPYKAENEKQLAEIVIDLNELTLEWSKQ